jgi:hypothetical protein
MDRKVSVCHIRLVTDRQRLSARHAGGNLDLAVTMTVQHAAHLLVVALALLSSARAAHGMAITEAVVMLGARAAQAAPLPVAITARVWLQYRLLPGTLGPPEHLYAAVTVQNRSTDSLQLALDGCYGRILVFQDSSLQTPALQSRAGRGTDVCTRPPRIVHLAPSGVHADTSAFHAGGALDRLPPGRYFTALRYTVGADTRLLPAGAIDLTRGLANVRLTARSAVVGTAPSALETTVTARNEGRQPVQLEFGACALNVHAFRTPDRSGEPVWRSERSTHPFNRRGGMSLGRACPMYLAVRTLAPGDTLVAKEFVNRTTMYELLADSLPDGTYHLTALLDLNWGLVRLHAGSVALRRAQAPLPKERSVNGITARVALSPAGPDSLDVQLTLTNRSGRRRVIATQFGYECPVQLAAYADSAARDRGTDGGERARWFARGCVVYVPPVALTSGTSRTFRRRILGPSRTDVGAERAHYSASVHLEDVATTRASEPVGARLSLGVLAAGSIPTSDSQRVACNGPPQYRVVVYVGERNAASPPDSVTVLLTNTTGDTIRLSPAPGSAEAGARAYTGALPRPHDYSIRVTAPGYRELNLWRALQATLPGCGPHDVHVTLWLVPTS